MTVSNAELVRAAYEACNREGVEAFAELLAPRVRWQERARTAAFTPATREQVVARMGELPAWAGVLIEPQEMIEREDRVVAVVRESPRPGSSNTEAQAGTHAHVWTIQDGQAVRLEVYRTRGDAMTSVFGYYRLLERLHAYLRPRTYVEVGVAQGHSLARALPGTRLIGIDPAPNLFDPAIASSAEIFRCTSDEYFAGHDLAEALEGQPIDLAFIDGSHLFENALRDFSYLEPHCSEQSVIVAHDCYPISRETSTRERGTDCWSGDVWKLVVCLREQRPDLGVHVVDVRPTGLGIFTGLDPGSTLIGDRYEEVIERYIPLGYDYLDGAKEERLAPIEDDWEPIRSLLPEPFRP